MEICAQGFGEPLLLSRRLPQRVVEFLLGYIDMDTLKTLRLVCKTSKGLMESPEVIHHFVVRVTGDAGLDEVLRAPDPVPWNNFLFARSYYNHFSSAGIRRFLVAYGNLVLHLELESGWRLEEHVVALLSGCPNIETLRMDELCLTYISADGDLSKQLLECWINLRHFHVEKFLGNGEPTGRMAFFFRLLCTCSQLESITVPHFNLLRMGLIPDRFQRFVVHPLMDAIWQGRLRSVTVSNKDFHDEQLLRLVIACRANGAVLHTEFKSRAILENVPREHLPVLDIIGNLYGVTDTIIRQPLTNVRLMKLRSLGFHIENDAYAMPHFRYLSDLEFSFLGFEDLEARERLELFVDRLAGMRRPTVKRLCIQYPVDIPMTSLCVSPVYLCTNFMNLRVLRLTSWDSEDDACLKLWPLVGRTLVELELSHIRILSDRGILGDDLSQPAFLQLKHLRKLTLENLDCEPGDQKVTDISFLYAFRYMRLRYLDFVQGKDSERQPPNFSAEMVKAMWNGVFGQSVEEFRLQGEGMMRTRPRAKEKLGRDQEVSLEDNPPRWLCCSIT